MIGAGAAGLAAAAHLSVNGVTVRVVEARDRLGGRILTRHEPGLAVPIELGAEFIHGTPAATLDWLKRGNLAHADSGHEHWSLEAGRLQPAGDRFEAMKRGLSRAPRPTRDLPFADFLEGAARRHLSAPLRRFARVLVEGFDAADATRVSTRAVLKEWTGGAAADAPTFRPVAGYDALIATLAAALEPRHATVTTHCRLTALEWKRGSVTAVVDHFGHEQRLRARQAVITLPLGVLQQQEGECGAVRFDPPLKTKRAALAGLGAGPVIKVVLQFDTAFWERTESGRYAQGAFFQGAGLAFPTFWSALPLRAPVLVAWAGGRNAQALAGLDDTALIDRALASLERLFARIHGIRSALRAGFVHDWQSDSQARGAYSYVVAGGEAARRQLAASVQDTLFFAGEACDTTGDAATVAGALKSGRRAAEQLLAASRL